MTTSSGPSIGSSTRRASVVGLGLIGGSIGLALRERGWQVSGSDHEPDRVTDALRLGVIDVEGLDPDSVITFVAVPVLAVADAVRTALRATSGLVTDVGSVKAPVVKAVNNSRFVGGHPMAGSEQEGLAGASAEMFEGAVWVLTPTEDADDQALATVRSVVSSFGADVVALAPDRHDALVAVVSHVPHLTAVTLMGLAAARAEEHAALLRLAAGGFRDMTRIASGHPAIWPDICSENRVAIVETLDGLIGGLQRMRDAVDTSDRDMLLTSLIEARAARQNLPARGAARSEHATEMRIPVPDRVGVLAEITTLAAELGVDLFDIEIAHSAEGTRGVLIVVVESERAERFREALLDEGFRPSMQPLR